MGVRGITGVASLFFPYDPQLLREALAEATREYFNAREPHALQRDVSWQHLSEMITIENILTGQVRIVRNGRELPIEMYSRYSADADARVLATDLLGRLRDQGTSIVINESEKISPVIQSMHAQVERYFGVKSQINIYLSFSQESAFTVHADSHNVLIMHLYGKKKWKCFGHDRKQSSSAGSAQGDVPPPEFEEVLDPGDLLYIPQGDAHCAEVVGPYAVHLTVELSPPNGRDLIEFAMKRAQKRGELCSTMPMFLPDEERRTRFDRLKKDALNYMEELTFDDFVAGQVLRGSGAIRNVLHEYDISNHAVILPTTRHSKSGELDPEAAIVMDAILAADGLTFADLCEAEGYGNTNSIRTCLTQLIRLGHVIIR